MLFCYNKSVTYSLDFSLNKNQRKIPKRSRSFLLKNTNEGEIVTLKGENGVFNFRLKRNEQIFSKRHRNFYKNLENAGRGVFRTQSHKNDKTFLRK